MPAYIVIRFYTSATIKSALDLSYGCAYRLLWQTTLCSTFFLIELHSFGLSITFIIFAAILTWTYISSFDTTMIIKRVIKMVIATMTTIVIVMIMVNLCCHNGNSSISGYFANLQRCYSSSISCSACGHYQGWCSCCWRNCCFGLRSLPRSAVDATVHAVATIVNDLVV